MRTVHETLSEQREIDFATVQTYPRRLETKGYASSRLDGGIRIDAAKTKARTVIRETVNDLVKRLFGGETMPLVHHLVEDRGIDGKDLGELRDLINRLDEVARGSRDRS